jgi:hypothetical protein
MPVKRAAEAISELARAQGLDAPAAPEYPDPCADPVMRAAPEWAHHLCAEMRLIRADVGALRRRLVGATLAGIGVAELARVILERFA